MAAIILDGNKIAGEIRAEVASEVRAMTAAGVRPGLAVVLVGHNPASEVYVRGKVKSSGEVGIYSEQHTPPETVSTEELLELIADLNRRDEIDGILVQLPLPPQVDAKKVLLAVDPAKDVDGFHPMNVGFLSTQRPGLVPCTPAGIMEILRRSQIPIAGQEAVVVGRSDIVGQADGDAVDQWQRDRHGLPFEDARSSWGLPAGGYLSRRDWPGGNGYARIREAGRDGDRRGHESGDGPRGVRTAICGECEAGRNVSYERVDAGWRRTSTRGRGCGSAYAGAGWRRAIDHRHVDGEHGEGREAATGRFSGRAFAGLKVFTTETQRKAA